MLFWWIQVGGIFPFLKFIQSCKLYKLLLVNLDILTETIKRKLTRLFSESVSWWRWQKFFIKVYSSSSFLCLRPSDKGPFYTIFWKDSIDLCWARCLQGGLFWEVIALYPDCYSRLFTGPQGLWNLKDTELHDKDPSNTKLQDCCLVLLLHGDFIFLTQMKVIHG